jgi:hypothetical protein
MMCTECARSWTLQVSSPNRAQRRTPSESESSEEAVCGVSCAGRRGAKWLGENRDLSESSSLSFCSVCSRRNDEGRGRREREDGGWRRLLALPDPARAAELPACSLRRVFSLLPRPRRRGPSARACSMRHPILSSSHLHGDLLLTASPSSSPFLSSAAVVGCAANTVLCRHVRLARLVPHRGRLDGLGLV